MLRRRTALVWEKRKRNVNHIPHQYGTRATKRLAALGTRNSAAHASKVAEGIRRCRLCLARVRPGARGGARRLTKVGDLARVVHPRVPKDDQPPAAVEHQEGRDAYEQHAPPYLRVLQRARHDRWHHPQPRDQQSQPVRPRERGLPPRDGAVAFHLQFQGGARCGSRPPLGLGWGGELVRERATRRGNASCVLGPNPTCSQTHALSSFRCPRRNEGGPRHAGIPHAHQTTRCPAILRLRPEPCLPIAFAQTQPYTHVTRNREPRLAFRSCK